MKPGQQGLYDARFEHDACGIGAVVRINGEAGHGIVDDALHIVEKLEHRAGKDAAGETGDGVGILLQISHAFFEAVAAEQGVSLGQPRDYGIGMFFLPRDRLRRGRTKKLFEVIAQKEGMRVLFWRDVPVCPESLGKRARDCMPHICQCFLARPAQAARGLDFDRRLYVARREFEQSASDTYVASLSSRTIVYKGMFLVRQLRAFYPDLSDARYASAIALVHSRFSTNTNPSWERAHPNRIILHNGEINTIRGNIDRMLAREETLSSPVFREDWEKVFPVVDPNGSDSAMLDNTLEFLMFAGMDLPKAVMLTIPEPWSKNPGISRSRRDMYHYYSTMMEPWDGPAAILFSDGDLVGAVLDRNGLRPARWCLTDDGRLILSSEVGLLDIPPEKILRKSRLPLGQMLVVDTKRGVLLEDAEIKAHYAAQHPYGEWLDRELVQLSALPAPNRRIPAHTQEVRDRLYTAFGYTYEEINGAIAPMARTGAEPTAAMGSDVPLAVLSEKHQPLFHYFKQGFAQVTNPPLDAIREEIVTDTAVYVGSDGNLLEDTSENCRVLQINNPILTNADMLKLKALDMPGLRACTLSLLYYKTSSLERALELLFIACDRAYRDGKNILILSDRGIDENHAAIPSLLAVSALEQYLVRTKKRTAVSVILESGELRDVHHFATLLGYGARAVNPYLAHECIGELIDRNMLDMDFPAAVDSYNAAILHGVVKIASKMGISSIQSYQSAQIFEIVGIRREVVDKYFTNTLSRVGGIGMEDIAEAVEWRHDRAFDPLGLTGDPTVDSSGFHKLRSNAAAEDHMYNAQTVLLLQRATQNGSYALFKQYSALVDDERIPHTLRGLLDFAVERTTPVSLEEVEPVEAIVRRFRTGAMSYGSISAEAHECLALAMNRLGGKSNSGEGGELPERLGTDKNSAIKQIASGRFGVTSEYLLSAQELQIKMAQGAKPGEGGYLTAGKVWPWVAKTRHSTPGVALLSPPPHHDIYSIEDLAQLIFDLKSANRDARISVKLVSEAGVGTIAAGVAKAGAQGVLISGYDGGTGAAPRSSLHNAGLPWEMGVAEAHQTLLQNGLRSRVRLEADGKLMTGRDVAIACMLGAEEFGFATAPLITLGCVMMRVCNLDTCPMGIATQNPALRKNFCGKPEYVENFMRFVAQELREVMAQLGIRTVDKLVGRTDLLRVQEKQVTKRAGAVDVSALLAGAPAHFSPEPQLPAEPDTLLKRLEAKKTLFIDVSCTDRAFGTALGSAITRKYGTALAADTYRVKCHGGAGQSFGAFIPKGLTLELEGEANDYCGKGLSGGSLIVYPDRRSTFAAEENVIIGNVALYGATSGKAFFRGLAGERFCVRNSGADAVVEGIGDHGCEYMTGGRVLILGKTGRNFAAGMSGGVAYVLDRCHDLYLRVNKEFVTLEQPHEPADIAAIHELLTAHADATGSALAQRLLADFPRCLRDFKKVVSPEYAAMTERIAALESQGIARGEAEMRAFLKREAT